MAYRYHNKQHTLEQVLPRSMSLATQQGKQIGSTQIAGRQVTEQEKELLCIAALFHEV